MEALIRVAIAKYVTSGECVYPSGALSLLFADNINEFASLTMCDQFRKEEFYNKKVDEAFRPFIYNMRIIFNEFSTIRYGC
jgi:hypothetical protein